MKWPRKKGPVAELEKVCSERDNAPRAFDAKVGAEAETANAREIEKLHAKIGRLTIENDFFARKLGR